MKKYIVLLFIIACQSVFATPQRPDYVIYEGTKYDWREGWYGYELIEKTKLPIPTEAVETTATNRVIWLTYTIENNKLYLTDVEAHIKGEIFDDEFDAREIVVKSFFSYYFPNQDKILISDVDGIILIPFGETEEDEYCFMKHENYHLLYFKHGSLKKAYSLEYSEFKQLKKKAFNKFKKTKQYKKAKQEVETGNLIFFSEYNCKNATIDDYIEYSIFSRGYVNEL